MLLYIRLIHIPTKYKKIKIVQLFIQCVPEKNRTLKQWNAASKLWGVCLLSYIFHKVWLICFRMIHNWNSSGHASLSSIVFKIECQNPFYLRGKPGLPDMGCCKYNVGYQRVQGNLPAQLLGGLPCQYFAGKKWQPFFKMAAMWK